MSGFPTLKFTRVAKNRWIAGDYEIYKTKGCRRGCYANHGQWSVFCESHKDAVQACNDRAARISGAAV